MKICTLLLASLVESARDMSLLEKYIARQQELGGLGRSGEPFKTGGTLYPNILKRNSEAIREQSRMFPFCTSGNPKVDQCYNKCKGSCRASLELYTVSQEDAQACRKSTPKHINKVDSCIKLAPRSLISGQINYDGEVDGFHVHKTVEINAPPDMFVQITVEDFNIGARNMSKWNEQCGYGGIFVFSGHGDINQMVRHSEFCGSMAAPVIDFKNKRYDGKYEMHRQSIWQMEKCQYTENLCSERNVSTIVRKKRSNFLT
jgi:hypothetical protein